MTAIERSPELVSGRTHPEAAETPMAGAIRPRALLSSPVLQGGLALAVYLAAWMLTIARPLVAHVTLATLDQRNMDPNFYVWSLRWWPYAVGHGLNPLYSPQVGAPGGYSLTWATTIPPLALLAAPLTLTAGPVVAFNLLTVLGPPLSAWAAFVLCRRLTSKFWPALIGGAVFGFSAYELKASAAGQLNLSYSLLLPILAYLLVRWWQGHLKNSTFIILAAATITVQFYLFVETFADLTGILVISLLIGLLVAGRVNRPTILRLAKLIAGAYVIALALAAPYLLAATGAKPPAPAGYTAADLASLVIPMRGNLGTAWLTRGAEGSYPISAAGYVGVPLVLLAILLAAGAWRKPAVRFLTCMLAFIVLASIGPVVYLDGRALAVLPWHGLYNLPLVRNAWPARLMLFAFLLLAIATALWLANSAGHLRWMRWPLAALIIAALGLNAFPEATGPQSSVPALISSGQFRSQLTQHEIVVVVSRIRNAGMLWQAQSGFYMRIAGGFINLGITHAGDLPQPVEDLKQASSASFASFESYVRHDKIAAILVDMRYKLWWVHNFKRLGLVGHQIGEVVVYPTDDCRHCRSFDATLPRHRRSRAGS